jgi:hypothetical protein
MVKETIVIEKEGKYNRTTYLKLVDDKVLFDDSDGEYGPSKFDLELLKEAIKKHEENG